MDIKEIKIKVREAIKIINNLYNNIFQLSEEAIKANMNRLNDNYINKFDDLELRRYYFPLYDSIFNKTKDIDLIRTNLKSLRAGLDEFIKRKEAEKPLDYHSIYKSYIAKEISAFECARRINQTYNQILNITYKKGKTHRIVTSSGEINVRELIGVKDNTFIEKDDWVALAEAWFAYYNNPQGRSNIELAGSKDFATKDGDHTLAEIIDLVAVKFSKEIAAL